MAATARSQQSIETGTMITRHVLCCSNSLGVELFLNEDTGEQFLRWCNGMPYEMEVAPVLPDFTAGFIIDHGRVISCAPILRKRLDYWLQHAEKIDG
ncbi:MAG: hypothetical protein DME91_09685 [Verrucomicrobia bacterium]|nr:MAG: hypothetical protein DME91_09685 [Verrucomicrobiota bacterium]